MFFTDLTTTRDMSKDFCWILDEPLVYQNDTYLITIYPGFDFDFASIPWLFRRVLPKNGKKYDRAACLHDALYASKIFGKADCDKLFLEAMLSDSVNINVANMMYIAVKYFGQSAYDEDENLSHYRRFIQVEIL
jgi:hypothetical protein